VSGRSSLYMRVFSDTTYTVIYGFFLLKTIAIFSKCSLLLLLFFTKILSPALTTILYFMYSLNVFMVKLFMSGKAPL
jgi:hypothetical protein